ncbi:hypothetical protein [Actinospongicola halichondriae]|uniref:8-oxoguanine DNA glycosylase OGG fold protein n=1 Tax=Actinospongicola halichondriae TaxID=3236844 RepID=UPI003D4A74EB
MSGADDEAINRVERYLLRENHDRQWAVDGSPLVLQVTASAASWRTTLDPGSLPPVMRDGTLLALEQIAAGGDVVTRDMLARLSSTMSDDRSMVACWVATMCWGAGPRNRPRLRQWSRSLSGASTAAVLRSSADELLHGKPEDAYRRMTSLPGVGEAYHTKWLWAVGLGADSTLQPTPLIRDSRVDKTLRDLQWWPEARGAAARWVRLCDALGEWADELGRRHPTWTVEAEHIEQLLFDRDHADAPGPCLRTWLRTQSDHPRVI